MTTRTACRDCGRKHLSQAKLKLSQAKVLLKEAFQGYPEHFEFAFEQMKDAEDQVWEAHDLYWDAMGHMAEASDELVAEYGEMANTIRDSRLLLQNDPNYSPDFDGMRRAITLLPEPA